MQTSPDNYRTLKELITGAVSVSWDGCHKIYLSMDAPTSEWFEQSYPVTVNDTPEHMLATVSEWYDESCPLRFVQSVRDGGDDCRDFLTVVPQHIEGR